MKIKITKNQLLYTNCSNEPKMKKKVYFLSKKKHIFFFFFVFSIISLIECQIIKKKVSVNEINFDSAVDDVQWCGHNNMTVLIKTIKGKLYRSSDGGKIWANISNNLIDNENKNNNSTESIETISVNNIVVNPIDKNIVLVVGTREKHYISEDAGGSFREINFPYRISYSQFHSTKPHWLLISSWSPECYANSYNSDNCMQSLNLTKDLGRLFKLIDIYLVQFSWGDKNIHLEDVIYYTRHNDVNGHQQKFSGWSKSVDFVQTSDLGRTQNTLVKQGNRFLISNGYIFVAKLNDLVKQTVSMMISTDGGKTFNKIKLPEDLYEKSYTVLDTSEGAIMLHVNHGKSMDVINTGNVYISDASGLNFTLSLPNNVRTVSGECEFDRVMSLDGVYIANFLDTNEGIKDDNLKFNSMDVRLERENILFETNFDKRKKLLAKGKNEDLVRTVISFDKGGAWSYLKAPAVDSKGNKYDCEDTCYLHLHGITNYHQYAPFYSVENAIGIIMGTGNVGNHLRYESDEVNTFLSRDGGVTWIEAHKGPYIYEFGDHGGLVVMADDLHKTNQIVFSWDEGKSWFDFDLGQFSIDVDNIVVEPNSSSVEFLVYGTRNDVGILYHIDFNALGQPPCKGIWVPDSISSDYENWVFTYEKYSNKCILGRKITYTRRKQSSECFNGKDLKKIVDKKPCECTSEDYECETGFTRNIGEYECKPTDTSLTTEGCTSSSYFYATAYRKIPGDICIGGWVPQKVPVPCPDHAPFNKSAKSILFIIFFIAIIMLIVTYIYRNPKFKNLFYNYGFDTFEHVKYSVIKTKRGNVNTNVFEPEMEFIDAEQDHNEEDVPTLLPYSNERNRSKNNDLKITRNRSSQNNFNTSRSISPPKNYSENIELL